jgi:hypothetical protein
MLKLRLLAMALTLGHLFFAASPMSAGERKPFFLILHPNTTFSESLNSLEKSGAHIRLTVPPRIIVGDVVSPVEFASLSVLGTAHSSRFSVDEVRSLGPVAVASALQWNKSLPKTSAPVGGFQSQSADGPSMDIEAPAFDNIALILNDISLQWPAIDGAYLYEIQTCSTKDCDTILRRTRTDRTQIEIPRLPGDPPTLHLRIRAGDRPDVIDAAKDTWGPWSTPQAVEKGTLMSGRETQAPTITSPVDGFTAIGFSTVLEWSNAPRVRIQLSKTSDFNTTLVDQIADGTEFSPPSSALHVNDRIYWRIAVAGEAQSPWSAVRSYTVSEPHTNHNDMFINPEAPK